LFQDAARHPVPRARENGYNVLALAQHLDDLAETF